MMRLAALFPIALAAPACAEDVPDFDACLNGEIARYERDLARHRDGPDADSFDIGSVTEIAYCGTLGIVSCDRGTDPFPCQHALGAKQDRLRLAVLSSLPEPEAVAGMAAEWSDQLYPVLWRLAYDKSAGPDCAGDTEAIEAWCVAREANRRLSSAILAWQLARFLDAAPKATEAGWADAPIPTRPRARKDSE